MKQLYVTGTSRPFLYGNAKRFAEMVGTALAEANFGLITGNAAGVEAWTAEAFCSNLKRIERDESKCFTQITKRLPNLRAWMPGSTFRSSPQTRMPVRSDREGFEAALAKSDAAILVGGHRGTLAMARRFMDRAKPVFPIPFSGGRSNEIFQEILRTWSDTPVEGLTRTQFLSLALPWNSGTGTLQNLLRGTLAETADIFISYRRNDVASGAGRLHRDLVEHFGTKRVFMDVLGIPPGQSWKATIDKAIQDCKVGVVVIGKRWTETHEDDIVHAEVGMLLEQNKGIAPVLIDGAQLPPASAIPSALVGLFRFQAPSLDNSNWEPSMAALIRQLDRAIGNAK
jgi:hypothetical protein